VTDQGWKEIGKHNPQQPQMFYPVMDKSLTLHKGDVVAARCTMKNYLGHSVSIGSTADDEMCNFYMMYYVEGDRILKRKYCFSSGPPYYYWTSDRRVGEVPDAVDRDASYLSESDAKVTGHHHH